MRVSDRGYVCAPPCVHSGSPWVGGWRGMERVDSERVACLCVTSESLRKTGIQTTTRACGEMGNSRCPALKLSPMHMNERISQNGHRTH